MIKKNTGLSKSNNADTSDMFKKEQDALAAKEKRAQQTIAKNKAQRKADAEWASKMANNGSPITVPGAFDGTYGFNKSPAPQDTASVPTTPVEQDPLNQKRKLMKDKPKSVVTQPVNDLDAQMSLTSDGNSLDAQTSKGKVRSSAKNNAQPVTKTKNPLLYKTPSWRDKLFKQDDEMVATVDDTASAPSTPQRKLPASVYDGEGPESVTSSGRDAREGRTKAEIQKMAADAGMPDPYANRKMPAQMTQAQIDARNASDSKFARDAQGKRKQSIAKALINPPSSDNDELISQTDDSAGAAVSPSFPPTTYSDAPGNFLQNNPQPADASTVTSSPIQNANNADDTSGVKPEDKKPEDKTADETNPFLTRLQKYYRDKEEKRREKRKEKKKEKTKEKEPIPKTSPYSDTEMGDGDYDIDSASMLTRNDKIASSSVRPEPGTGAKAFAKQLGYSSFADFLKANKKNVNKAANGNWVVHPNKDYIPAK